MGLLVGVFCLVVEVVIVVEGFVDFDEGVGGFVEEAVGLEIGLMVLVLDVICLVVEVVIVVEGLGDLSA